MKALVFNPTPLRWAFCKAAGLLTPWAFYGRLSGLRLEERPTPSIPGPGWVRLRTILGGVCGTDLALIALRNHPATMLQAFASFPAILGHENVAIIDELGPDVPAQWRAGQRVCVEPAISCVPRGIDPPCRMCAAGLTSLCEEEGFEGLRVEGSKGGCVEGISGPHPQTPQPSNPQTLPLPPRALLGLNHAFGGCWAAYFVAHQSQLHAVPDTVTNEMAVLTDPIASATHAVFRRRPAPGETVLVQGSGVIAFGIIAAVRALGHDNRILAVVRHAFQAEIARRLGATETLVHRRKASKAERYADVAWHTGGRRIAGRFGNQTLLGGADVTYDCTGSGAGLTDACHWTRPRGTVVAVGTSGITLMDTTPIWFNELTILGVNGRQIEDVDGKPLHTYDWVLEAVADTRLNLSPIQGTRYPLSEYRRAFADLLGRRRSGVVKAVFEPER